MFTHPRRVSPDPNSLFEEDGEKPRFKFERPSVLEWPLLFVKSFRVVRIYIVTALTTC